MESEIKGQSLKNYASTLRDIRGDAVADRVLALVSRELRDGLVNQTILTGGWYPVAHKRELHEAGAKVTGEARFARTMSYEMTQRDLSGLYRTFVRIATPRYVLSIASRIFSTYFRPGEMRVVERRSGFVKVELTRCFGFDVNLWEDVMGGCEATLAVAGAQACRVRILSGGKDGDASAIATAWWSETGSDSVAPPGTDSIQPSGPSSIRPSSPSSIKPPGSGNT
jgi:hypothetical protein